MAAVTLRGDCRRGAGSGATATRCQPKPGSRDAIKKRLDEKNEELARAREARDHYEDEKAHPSPKPPPPSPPPPPSKDDDYLQEAQDLMETLLRTFGSVTGTGALYESEQADLAAERKKLAGISESSQQAREMLHGVELHNSVERLEKERATLEQEYLDAGGRLGIQQFTIDKQTSDRDPTLKRLEEEYVAKERKRLQDEEEAANTKSKPPAPLPSPGPPPPPPPVSMILDSPRWDVAASYGISGSSFGLSASYQVDYVGNGATTAASLLNAPIAPLDQMKDAVFRRPDELSRIVLNPFIERTPQDATVDWRRPSSNLVAMLRPSRFTVRAELQQPSLPQPSAKVFFTNLGGSTGDTVRMTIVNDGNVPVRIESDGFALVPVANVTTADVERELQRLARFPQQTVTVRAYCRDIGKAVPQAGTVMRLADASVQAQMVPFQRVIAASGRLLDAGVLKPDVDDRALYLDSVRQWARWTMAEKFNERSFITAFIEHTKKNTIAAGQKWERSFDGEARQIAGERWRDVQRVLTEAQTVR